MSIVKHRVCAGCESLEILYVDCRCVWDKNYPTMELEFERCDCCGREDSRALDSEFNIQQRKKMFPDRKQEEEEP